MAETAGELSRPKFLAGAKNLEDAATQHLTGKDLPVTVVNEYPSNCQASYAMSA
jgi:hypothetical protein